MHTKGGLGLKGMLADVLEQTLQAEMDQHLGYDRAERTTCEGKKNYRNGSVKRTMKTQLGEVDVNVPRDRNGEFELQIIGKYQRNADGIEEHARLYCWIWIFSIQGAVDRMARVIKIIICESYRKSKLKNVYTGIDE